MKAIGNKKQCPKCNKVLPLAEFAKNRSAVDGLQTYCRNCLKTYYDLNAKREYNRQYVAENRERVNEYKRRYREEHPEVGAADAERVRRWYQDNKERHLERSTQWRADNPDKVKQTQRDYYERNQEARRMNTRRWRSENPEQVARQNEERRAREAGAGLDSDIDYGRIYRRDRDICYLCGKKVKKSERHLDHVIPLARGGSHSEDNLKVTHARCNLIKGTKLVEELDKRRFE